MADESPDIVLADIRRFLGEDSESLTSPDAMSRLVDFQRSNHPDHFQDPQAHNAATERFKEAGTLLQRLRTAVEKSVTLATPSAALVHVPHLEMLKREAELSQALARAADVSTELKHLQLSLDLLKRENTELKEALSRRRQSTIANAQTRLIKPYKPSTKTFVTLGVTAGIPLLMALLTQIEDAVKKITSPIGLSPKEVGIVLFIAFLTTVLLTFRAYVRSSYLARTALRLTTTRMLQAFVDHIEQKLRNASDADTSAKKSSTRATLKPTVQFTEEDVVVFLEGQVAPKGFRERLLSWVGLRSFREESVNDLKNLMIAHMIHEGYAQPGPIDRLQRVFRVRMQQPYETFDSHYDILSDLDLLAGESSDFKSTAERG